MTAPMRQPVLATALALACALVLPAASQAARRHATAQGYSLTPSGC